MKILLVDDTKTIHDAIKDFLSGQGHEYEDAYDGRLALEKISSDKIFDLICLDWEMPNLNGIDTLKVMRERGIKTPILMVITKSDPALIESALSFGANEYVMKPFTKDILIEKMSSILPGGIA